jgi:hypothetical protein
MSKRRGGHRTQSVVGSIAFSSTKILARVVQGITPNRCVRLTANTSGSAFHHPFDLGE